MERKIGLFSFRALAKASSPHGYHSTGLCACCRRYGDFSCASRFVCSGCEGETSAAMGVGVTTSLYRMLATDNSPAILFEFRMTYADIIFLSLFIGVIAFLYSSVGHAGASGYIAVMALWGLQVGEIRPTALILNIMVASITAFQFWEAGHFSWRLFWPFALLSVPAAYFGGYLQLSATILKTLIGLVLLFSAVRLFFRREDPPQVASPSLPTSIGVGAGIGFLSGLTGTGGGIFLTPTLLFF